MAVIELARFGHFSDVDQTFLEQLSETLGVVLNAIIANQRTEQLLEQSAGARRASCRSARRSCSPSRRSCGAPTPSSSSRRSR